MKKIISLILIIMLFFITGCDQIDNTPTKKVETMLMKYQTLDKDVLDDLNKTVDSEPTLNTAEKSKYKEVLKKQFSSLTYTIKDEEIDGDNAEVDVEIEVNDLTKAIKDSENYLNSNPKEFQDDSGNFVQSKYTDYKLNQMDKTSIKVKYSLELTLTNSDGEWVVDNLTETERQKIHGIYNY